MENLSGSISLEQLLTLNIDEVQAHLNSLQWSSLNDRASLETFYKETRAILLIIFIIDTFLAQPLLIYYIEYQSHLFALRTVLNDEHQTRLDFLSNYHGSSQ